MWVSCLTAAQQQVQLCRMQEFRRSAEAAVYAVEVVLVLAHRQCQRHIVQCRARNGLRQGVGECRNQVRALRHQFAAVFRIHPGDALHQFRESGQAVPRLFGEVRATEERRAVRQQKHRQRPAAVAPRQHVVGALINLVEIGTLFAIHLDVDEMLIHHGGDGRVLERFMRHDMTPVAGGITDGKQDGLVLRAGELQRGGVPCMPFHRIIGVLLQIGAGFLGE